MIKSKTACFVPRTLYDMVLFQDKPLSVLADLSQISEMFGLETASSLALLNDLYDDGLAKNIYPNPDCLGLPKIDLLNNKGTLAEKDPSLFNALRSRGESRRLAGYTDILGDPNADIQYLELFNITPEIVGVTIAKDSLPNDQETKKKICLKLMGFLHRYGVSVQDVLSTEMYKEIIRLASGTSEVESMEAYFAPLYRMSTIPVGSRKAHNL